MNKEFVTYEQALALKELGFNELCFSYWFNNKRYFPNSIEHCSSQERCFYITGGLLAPTFSQAFRWFREKYGLVIDWNNLHQDNFGYYIGVCIKNKHLEETVVGVYKTYEEAEQACLDKLIEIVRNTKS